MKHTKKRDAINTKLRVDDVVSVISGKDKGKEGKIVTINRRRGAVVITGINFAKKAMRKRKQEDKGGIAEIEMPFSISNVMLSVKGKRSRIRYEIDAKSNKKRISRKTGEVV